jgi:hypothetical protein
MIQRMHGYTPRPRKEEADIPRRVTHTFSAEESARIIAYGKERGFTLNQIGKRSPLRRALSRPNFDIVQSKPL